MPVKHVTGKQCTFTFGTLDASAQVTNVSPSRSSSSDTVQTLGDAVTTAAEKELTVSVELLFDPTTNGISALLHSAWVAGTEGTAEIDYGTATSTYQKIIVTELGEEIPADGLVTQSVTFTTGTPDAFTWATA